MDDRHDEEPAEDELAAMAALIERRMILAWGAFRERLREALASGDRRPLHGALSDALYAELRPRLVELPLVDVDEEPSPLQILDVRLEEPGEDEDESEARFVYTVREERRSGLAALLLTEPGLLQAELSMGLAGLFRLDAITAAAEPRPGARTVEVDVGTESLLPRDYAPPRYRVEPQGGEGLFCGVADLSQALELAAGLSEGGPVYRVYDRESLERRGALVARFDGGRRL